MLTRKVLHSGKAFLLSALLIFSICLTLTGCGSKADDSSQSDDPNAAKTVTLDDTTAARTDTHYALYHANKELKKLTYLDEGYAALNETYDKAARAWYKGQYYMDLVTCGEITEEADIQDYCARAVDYFAQAKSGADEIFDTLTK